MSHNLMHVEFRCFFFLLFE